MRRTIALGLVLLASTVGGQRFAQSQGLTRPDLVLRQIVAAMPRGEKQEVRVLTASLKPGDRTVFHTHRSPVTVYILEGAFTLEMEAQGGQL